MEAVHRYLLPVIDSALEQKLAKQLGTADGRVTTQVGGGDERETLLTYLVSQTDGERFGQPVYPCRRYR